MKVKNIGSRLSYKPTFYPSERGVESNEGAKRVLGIIYGDGQVQEVHFNELDELGQERIKTGKQKIVRAKIFRYWNQGASVFPSGVYEEHPHFLPQLKKMQAPYIQTEKEDRAKQAAAEKIERSNSAENPPPAKLQENAQKAYSLSDLPIFDSNSLAYGGQKYELRAGGVELIIEASAVKWGAGYRLTEPINKSLVELVEQAELYSANLIAARHEGKKSRYFLFRVSSEGALIRLQGHLVASIKAELSQNPALSRVND